MEQAKVVVTGASGHIGYHVARELLRRGHAVHLLVRAANASVIELVGMGAAAHAVDLAVPAAFGPILAGAACLFHLAAENTTDLAAAVRVRQSTAGLTRAVLTAAVDQGVGVIVYTSSVVVLGRSASPARLLTEADRTRVAESPYVRGKVEAERFCDALVRVRGADVRRVYPSWVVGPGDLRGTPPHQVIARFLQKGQRADFAGGISIAAVEAVAKGHVDAWLRGRPRESYVLGGENVTFRQFFNTLRDLTGKPGPIVGLPKWAVVGAATLMKAAFKPLGKPLPLDPEYARTVVGAFSWYDSGKAVRELGYTIPPARESLAAAVAGERARATGLDQLGRPRTRAAAARLAGPAPAAERPPLLITGVPGWLGNRFVDVMIHGDRTGRLPAGRKVRLLVEPRFAGAITLPADRFEVVAGDITDPASVARALDGIGTVFHLAGAIYPPRLKTLYRVNAEGTRNLVDQCVRAGVRRIIYMGTDSICGHGRRGHRVFSDDEPARPYRHYGASKAAGEAYLLEQSRAGKVDGTSIRGFWFFGPGYPPRQQNFLDMLKWKRQIVFGDGKNYRSLSHVDNTVAAFFAAETAPATYGKWYWVGDPRPDYTVDEVYARLCRAAGSAYRPLYFPRLMSAAARAADWAIGKLGRLHPTIHAIGKFSFDIAGGIGAARRDFGFEPVVSLTDQPGAFLESIAPAREC